MIRSLLVIAWLIPILNFSAQAEQLSKSASGRNIDQMLQMLELDTCSFESEKNRPSSKCFSSLKSLLEPIASTTGARPKTGSSTHPFFAIDSQPDMVGKVGKTFKAEVASCTDTECLATFVRDHQLIALAAQQIAYEKTPELVRLTLFEACKDYVFPAKAACFNDYFYSFNESAKKMAELRESRGRSGASLAQEHFPNTPFVKAITAHCSKESLSDVDDKCFDDAIRNIQGIASSAGPFMGVAYRHMALSVNHLTNCYAYISKHPDGKNSCGSARELADNLVVDPGTVKFGKPNNEKQQRSTTVIREQRLHSFGGILRAITRDHKKRPPMRPEKLETYNGLKIIPRKPDPKTGRPYELEDNIDSQAIH